MKRRAELARGAYRNLSVRRRCFLLGLNRSTVYYQAANRNINTVDHMNEIQEIYARYPFKGYKRITDDLNYHGYLINHKRVYRLMKLMGLQAVYPKKNYRYEVMSGIENKFRQVNINKMTNQSLQFAA